MRLFRTMLTIISFFQKLIKGGVGIRAGGLENFSKINKRGGRLFGTREYLTEYLKRSITFRMFSGRNWSHRSDFTRDFL